MSQFVSFEHKYVKEVYDEIACDFDRTRNTPWKFVSQFILNLSPNSKMLDLGCGNGKYLSVRSDLDIYALDNCANLISIVNLKYPTVKTFVSDVLTTNFPSNYFDAIISIAVIHHLSTVERRLDMLKEIIRILKLDGVALITAWATSQNLTINKKISENNDFLIPWTYKKLNKTFERFYHLFEKDELEQLCGNFDNIKIINSGFDKDNWYVVIQKT